jgi:hypothetical protein
MSTVHTVWSPLITVPADSVRTVTSTMINNRARFLVVPVLAGRFVGTALELSLPLTVLELLNEIMFVRFLIM